MQSHWTPPPSTSCGELDVELKLAFCASIVGAETAGNLLKDTMSKPSLEEAHTAL